MAEYCTDADLYKQGLPRGALPNPGQYVDAADASTDTIELDQHGLATDDAVRFRPEVGGALPAPLVEGTTYYAIAVDDSHFQVATSLGGVAVNLTSTGNSFIVIAPSPRAAARAWASRMIDQFLPAHLVPLSSPYPPLVVMTTADLAIGRLVGARGASSKSLSQMVDEARKLIASWAKGLPVRGDNVPPAANTAVSATVPYLDVRGWRRFGGRE